MIKQVTEKKQSNTRNAMIADIRKNYHRVMVLKPKKAKELQDYVVGLMIRRGELNVMKKPQ